jgi:hypothetical protein
MREESLVLSINALSSVLAVIVRENGARDSSGFENTKTFRMTYGR